MNNKIIGARMRRLRKKKGMTVCDLAEEIGMSQAQASRLELGVSGFRSDTLTKVANALHVDEAYLLQKWASDGSIKNLRLDVSLLGALHDPDFFFLVRALATSKAGTGRLLQACLALLDVLRDT